MLSNPFGGAPTGCETLHQQVAPAPYVIMRKADIARNIEVG
jgi:hypothetical protein